MIVELESVSEGLDWLGFFELSAKSEYIPIWRILGVPKQIIARPQHLISSANKFLDTPLPGSEFETLHPTDLETILENKRAHDLRRLTSIFAEITNYYGKQASEELYTLVIRTFLHKRGKIWSIWFDLFTRGLEIYFPITDYLNESDVKQLEEISATGLMMLNDQQKTLIDLGLKELTDGPFVIFENAIEHNCAFQIWREIDNSFRVLQKEKIYQWGFDNADYLTTKEEWSQMKEEFYSKA